MTMRCRCVALALMLACARSAPTPIEPADKVALLPAAAAAAVLSPQVTVALLAGLAAAAQVFDSEALGSRTPAAWAQLLGATARDAAADAAVAAGASAAVVESVAQEALALSVLESVYEIESRTDLELSMMAIWNWLSKQLGFGDDLDPQAKIQTLKERRAEMRDSEGLSEKQRESSAGLQMS